MKSQQGTEWEESFGVGKAIIHQFAGSERQGSFVMIYLPPRQRHGRRVAMA